MQNHSAPVRVALILTACVSIASCGTGGTAKSDAQERGAARVGPRVLVAHESTRPPETVSDELDVPTDEDTACALAPEGLDIYSDPRAEVGARTRLCLFGFEDSGPVTFTTSSPDGKVETEEYASYHDSRDGGIAYYWDVPVEGPTGKWGVHVARGESTATDEIEVGAATYPHVTVEAASPFDPIPDVTGGERVPIAMSGFALDTDTSLQVYVQASGDSPFRWVNTLRIPPSEARGGQVSVPTGTGDPAGRYCFVYHGTPFGDDAVCGSTLFELI